MAFNDRSTVLGFAQLTAPAIGSVVSFASEAITIPAGTTYLRVFFNSAASPTGAPVLAFHYWTEDPSATVGIQFTDTGGYFEVVGNAAIQNFKAVSLSGNDETLQIYFHNTPWGMSS